MKTFVAALLVSTAFTSPAWAAINASDYGVSASNGDNASALERAFAAGRGQEVVLPAGTIRYSRAVKADSVKIRGSSGTIMAPSNPANQRIYLTGNSPSISDVRFDFKPTQRCGSCVEKAGVWVQNAKGFRVEGVTFNGHATGVPTKHGQGGGNLFIKNSQGGEIRNNRLYGTLADAIHMTGGSRDIDVTGNRIENASDDGIAVVAYGKDGTGDVRISGNTVIGNRWGRNITAVGSDNVRITNNYIKGNSADGAGVYVASEPAYNTDAPKNILIQGNSIQDTGGPGKGHGQVMLWSGKGPISGVTVKDNEIRDSKRDDLAVVLSGSMSNVTLEGNNVDGEISRRNGGSFDGGSNTTNDPKMANGTPIPAGTPAPAPSGIGTETPLDRNLNSVADNINNTDDEFWSAVESGEAGALRRLNDLVSGGVLIRQGNSIINRATGQITSTVGRTIGDAVDGVMRPVEDAVSGLGNAILCSVGGGWVALLLKINLCASKQLKIAGRQLEEMQKMTAPVAGNAVGDAGSISDTILARLGLYGGAEVGEEYQTGASVDMTPDESIAYGQHLRTRTDQARRSALETAALNVQAEKEYARMADEALALSQSAVGQTAAVQALAQLERAKEGAASARASTQVALENARLMAEEEDRAGERLAISRRERLYRGLSAEGAEAAPFNMFQ